MLSNRFLPKVYFAWEICLFPFLMVCYRETKSVRTPAYILKTWTGTITNVTDWRINAHFRHWRNCTMQQKFACRNLKMTKDGAKTEFGFWKIQQQNPGIVCILHVFVLLNCNHCKFALKKRLKDWGNIVWVQDPPVSIWLLILHRFPLPTETPRHTYNIGNLQIF